tara:strand:- start:30 stop:995 length:966 start_codon:yes stop_codon:yes gene_type:complete
MIKTPNFWFKKNHISSILLSPLAFIYYQGHLLKRFFEKEIKITTPTICIGNLNIGGSGKTPVVIAVRKLLSKKYRNIFVLSRGYKSLNKKPKIVSNDDTAKEVGDEAYIHKKYGKICIARDRKEGALLCEKLKSDLIILDDGFQSKNIKKNIAIIVVDSDRMFGNQRLLPAGPLREKIEDGIKRADAIIYIKNNDKKLSLEIPSSLPVFLAYRRIVFKKKPKREIFAFCGLGNPENFFKSLENFGLVISKKKVFPDHHYFNNLEIEEIIKIAETENIDLVTTLKDYVKIDEKYKNKIKVADLEIDFRNKNKFLEFLNKKLK